MTSGIKYARDYQDEILRLYVEEDWSIRKISTTLDLRLGSVRKIVVEQVGLKQRGLTTEDKQTMLALFEEGLSKAEISRRLNTDPSNVTRILLNEFGIQPEPPTRKPDYEHLREQFIADYQAGMSAQEIGIKYKVNTNTVLRYLRKEEIPVRGYSEALSNKGIDFDYFNQLTPFKVRQLGMLWATSGLKKTTSGQSLRIHLNEHYEAYLREMLAHWVDTSQIAIGRHKTKTLDVRMSHQVFCQQFQQWGLEQTYPTCLTPNQDAFWEGFLTIRVTRQKGGMFLSTKNLTPAFTQTLLDYLKHKKAPYQMGHMKGRGYLVRGKHDMVCLLTQLPYLQAKMKQGEPSPLWGYVEAQLTKEK